MSWMVWVWGGLCGAAVVVAVLATAGMTWLVRRRAAAAVVPEPADAIDVALMESLAQMMVEAEAETPGTPRAAIALECAALATKNQREALLVRVAGWEALGGKPREPKGFNDMKRALR